MNHLPSRTLKGFALIDWENVRIQIVEKGYSLADYFSMKTAFEEMKAWLESIGEVSFVIIYATQEQILLNQRLWDELGFDIRLCPRDKLGKDTTDRHLILWGSAWIENFKDLGFICLGAGDIDYSKMIKGAKQKGAKLAFILGDQGSLSGAYKHLIDCHPVTGEKMIHILSPSKKEQT